jgi:organic radical activating enzyme
MVQVAVSTLRIAEAFHSLQGEGPSVGEPAHFVRLQGCSVGCRWCDTRYSWDPARGTSESVEDLERRLRQLGHAELLVITGGEPLENRDFVPIVSWGAASWRRVEVETSGVLAPPPVERNVSWNWSPKLPAVTPRWAETWAHAADFLATSRFACKVVVDSEPEWDAMCELLDAHGVPAGRVFVMPQGTNAEELTARARWLAPLCLARGYHLTFRLHVLLWGARRGV